MKSVEYEKNIKKIILVFKISNCTSISNSNLEIEDKKFTYLFIAIHQVPAVLRMALVQLKLSQGVT